MTMSITSPVTGAAQTGFTSPTYTLVDDTAPDVNSKQKAVTALGGTQTGVAIHSVSQPFTVTVTRPKQYKVLGKANPITGLVASVPNNSYRCLVRKGVLPLAGQPFRNATVDVSVNIPAGADTADAANVRAAISLAIGALQQISAGIGDTAVTGIL